MDKPIPFNRPFIAGKELFYISRAVLEGQLGGDGKFTRLCQEWIERKFDAPKVFLTNSSTSALEICAILCDIKPGDEVIMPSYTFISTANAFRLRGAHIRFVDIREDTLNLDENLVEAAITPRTRAIVPVHYAGVACEMDTLSDIAERHNLFLVEDASQGVNSRYRRSYLGTIGHLGTYSFHETKNLISGEGGALLVNDENFIERAEIIRDKGTTRGKFFRGEVDKYTWVDIGSSHVPSELTAAFLYAQLEEADTITAGREEIHSYYARKFAPMEESGLFRTPSCPGECRSNYHMFYIILPGNEARDGLIRHLKQMNIHAVFHYVPLHTSPMGRKMGYGEGDFPVTEEVSSRILRLPCYYELTRAEQDRVVEGVKSFLSY